MSFSTRCDGATRRDALRIGGLTAMGLGLGDFFAMQNAASAAGKPLTAKAKSCILIWLDGGPSHLETFDPKPDAPDEVRGPFETIGTKIPGIGKNRNVSAERFRNIKYLLSSFITQSINSSGFTFNALDNRLSESPDGFVSPFSIR